MGKRARKPSDKAKTSEEAPVDDDAPKTKKQKAKKQKAKKQKVRVCCVVIFPQPHDICT